MLIPIGMFKEHCGERFPSILNSEEMVLDAEEQEKVANYLASCPVIVASPGVVRSVFDDSAIAGTPSIRTDGFWVWQDTYSYYVRMRKASVGKEFLLHMRERSYIAPIDAEIDFSTVQFPW